MAWFTPNKEEEKQAQVEDIWTVCPSCHSHIMKDEWEKCLRVCPKCGFHDRLTSRERIALLIDKDSFREINADMFPNDPLQFSDLKGAYRIRGRETADKLGISESVITGSGNINGKRIVIAVMDFRFMGGSLSSAAGEKILAAAEHAIYCNRAFVVVTASGGARMHEGIVSLMQMAKTCAAVAKLREKRCPYISILTDPTTGGVSASFAMMGDINIAEPGATIGFAGRRVIEQTIKQKLPKDFQTAEYLLEHGFIDQIVPRCQLKDYLSRFLDYRQSN